MEHLIVKWVISCKITGWKFSIKINIIMMIICPPVWYHNHWPWTKAQLSFTRSTLVRYPLTNRGDRKIHYSITQNTNKMYIKKRIVKFSKIKIMRLSLNNGLQKTAKVFFQERNWPKRYQPDFLEEPLNGNWR